MNYYVENVRERDSFRSAPTVEAGYFGARVPNDERFIFIAARLDCCDRILDLLFPRIVQNDSGRKRFHGGSMLQDKPLIEYSRGIITIVDRKGLERASCPCYNSSSINMADSVLGVTPRAPDQPL